MPGAGTRHMYAANVIIALCSCVVLRDYSYVVYVYTTQLPELNLSE